jgi:DNA-directed RNA polymerase subunit RPC12/RpoP
MTTNKDLRSWGERVPCSRCKSKLSELRVQGTQLYVVCHRCGDALIGMNQKPRENPAVAQAVAAVSPKDGAP